MLVNTFVRALGRRKIEAVVLAALASGTAVGLRTSADEQGVASVSNVVATAAGAVAPAPGATTKYLAATLKRDPFDAKSDLADLSNSHVDSWVKKFTTSQRGSYATYLRRMTKYDAMISQKLAKRDMPQELIYLAMIESGFNPTAKSRVAATGLWQFMTPTARDYGLKVSRRVDERKNPSRSTDAALEYLSDLYDRFGSWYLAAAAYNTGQGRVARVMKQVTGRTKGTDADFYRIASRLPRETRDYVPKLVAAARIGQNPARYGFSAD